MENKSYFNIKLVSGLLLLTVIVIIIVLYFVKVRNNTGKTSFMSKLFGLSQNKDSKRMITYWEGWGPTVYGTPKNYTHMIFSFIVPYHYWGGYCSAYCTPWISVDTGLLETPINMIKDIKSANPNIKILLSFGGWNLNHYQNGGYDNENGCYGCRRVCAPTNPDDDDPASYNQFNNVKYSCKDINTCQTNPNDSKIIQPITYCYGPDVDIPIITKHVADRILKLINAVGADGMDMDIEDTFAFNEPSNNVFSFIKNITKNLSGKILNNGNKIILSQAPINAYVITDPIINTESAIINNVTVKFVNVAKNYTRTSYRQKSVFLFFCTVLKSSWPMNFFGKNCFKIVVPNL